MSKKAKTVGQVLNEVKELNERIAVHEALSSYLRTRYLPRDSMASQAKLVCDYGPVSEAMVEEVAQELEEAATEMRKSLKVYQTTEIGA
jgi:uncharacterized protein YaaN involved in tellurite resistance